MLMNSLAALALGFALDMMFGDPNVIFFPQKLVAALIKILDRAFRHSYKNSDEAQHMGGVMLVCAVIIIFGGLSAILMVLCYSVNNLLGIVYEAILCWSAISVRSLRLKSTGIMRAVRGNNLNGARKRFGEMTGRDTDELEMDDIIKGTVETVAKDTVDMAVAPIFWCAIFGGPAGFLCRAINILDSTIGFKTETYRFFGRSAAIVDDILTYIPARIGALLMLLDTAFLKLSTKKAWTVYKKDKRRSPSPNAAQTQSVCAGALELTLGGDYSCKGEVIKRPTIGDGDKEATSNDIFWANQLLMGTACIALTLSAAIMVAVYFIF